MSRVFYGTLTSANCFPRASGDEPAWEYWEDTDMLFSPR